MARFMIQETYNRLRHNFQIFKDRDFRRTRIRCDYRLRRNGDLVKIVHVIKRKDYNVTPYMSGNELIQFMNGFIFATQC